MSDPLSNWWVHDLSVERFTGTESYGDDFAAAETVTGFYDDSSKLVPGANGEQIVAAGVFAFPADVAYIPLQSRVTLPAQFGGPAGGRVCRVVSTAVGDAGGQPTPNHQEVALQ